MITPFISQLKRLVNWKSDVDMDIDHDCITISIRIKHLDSGFKWFSPNGYQFDFGVICIPKQSAVATANKDDIDTGKVNSDIACASSDKSNCNTPTKQKHVQQEQEIINTTPTDGNYNIDRDDNTGKYSNVSSGDGGDKLAEMSSILDDITTTMDQLTTLKNGSNCGLQTFINFLNCGSHININPPGTK